MPHFSHSTLYLLLIYKVSVVEFCILIFYLENVLCYNTNSHGLPVDSLGFYFSVDIHIICELHIALALPFYSF